MYRLIALQDGSLLKKGWEGKRGGFVASTRNFFHRLRVQELEALAMCREVRDAMKFSNRMSELVTLLRAWPIGEVCSLSPITGGTNNSVWRVETSEKRSYALRLTPEVTDVPRLRYEAALLTALAEHSLPFLLPLPLPTSSGERLLLIEQEVEHPVLAILCPWLPGKPFEGHQLMATRQAAVTLALLDAALLTLSALDVADLLHPPVSSTELTRLHPLVPEPLLALERLPLCREQVGWLDALLSSVMQGVVEWEKRLPRQLVHRDFVPGNLLVEGTRVTAVLDFEYAGYDVRLLDLCVALTWWSMDLLGTGQEWEVMDAFGMDYMEQFPLQKEELLAIPDVLRLLIANDIVHRMGRYQVGLETDRQMVERVEHCLWRDDWLAANRERLLSMVMNWEQDKRESL